MNAAANSANLAETQVQDGDLVDCLEKGVQYWTDFSKVHFHPRSHYELNCLWMDAQEFDNYGSGREILAGGLQLEEINERLRYFVEDCDHMQVCIFPYQFYFCSMHCPHVLPTIEHRLLYDVCFYLKWIGSDVLM